MFSVLKRRGEKLTQKRKGNGHSIWRKVEILREKCRDLQRLSVFLENLSSVHQEHAAPSPPLWWRGWAKR